MLGSARTTRPACVPHSRAGAGRGMWCRESDVRWSGYVRCCRSCVCVCRVCGSFSNARYKCDSSCYRPVLLMLQARATHATGPCYRVACIVRHAAGSCDAAVSLALPAMVLQRRMRGDVYRWANEKAVIPEASVRRDEGQRRGGARRKITAIRWRPEVAETGKPKCYKRNGGGVRYANLFIHNLLTRAVCTTG